jgi:glutaredoxin-related protein
LQQYCHDTIGGVGRLVVFMKGSPSNPTDYYSQSLMLMLQAGGLDITQFKSVAIDQENIKDLSPHDVYYFDVYDNGDDIKELYVKSSYLRSDVVRLPRLVQFLLS